MLRTLLISFFLVTSYTLYMGKGTQLGSSNSPAPIYLSAPKAPSPEAKIVRTVAKPYTANNRRFINKEHIAQKAAAKEAAKKIMATKAVASYLPQIQKRSAKKALNVGDKYRIALHIKSELKRVGCFKGTISGSWGGKVHTALSHFNITAAQDLKTGQPDLKTLATLRSHVGSACNTRYRQPPKLILVQLPVAKPQMTAKIATAYISTAEPVPVASDDAITTPVITKPKRVAQQQPVFQQPVFQQRVYKTKTRKKKNRKIARFTQDEDFFDNSSYTKRVKKYKRRPPASLVGTRKKSLTPKRHTRKARRLKKARYRHRKAKRKRFALRKKHRKIRRRYRRARRRFGFSTSGELGYW